MLQVPMILLMQIVSSLFELLSLKNQGSLYWVKPSFYWKDV